MLRDLRTWHAGMPNESEDYRIMLALGYQVGTHAPNEGESSIGSLYLVREVDNGFLGTVVSKPYSPHEITHQSRQLLYEACRPTR